MIRWREQNIIFHSISHDVCNSKNMNEWWKIEGEQKKRRKEEKKVVEGDIDRIFP